MRGQLLANKNEEVQESAENLLWLYTKFGMGDRSTKLLNILSRHGVALEGLQE